MLGGAGVGCVESDLPGAGRVHSDWSQRWSPGKLSYDEASVGN